MHCFFPGPSQLSSSTNNIFKVKEALININNSSTKHCNSKNFAYYEIFCKTLFFSSNLSQGTFLKNRNTTRAPTEMKHNLSHHFFFPEDKMIFI